MRLRLRLIALLAALLTLVGSSFAQGKEYATWSATMEPTDIRAGESGRILIHLKVEDPWHVYGTEEAKPGPDGLAPMNTVISLPENKVLETNGTLVVPNPKKDFDKNFNIDVTYYEGEAIFSLPIKVKEGVSGKQEVTLDYSYQACRKGTCDIPRNNTLKVSFDVAPGEPRSERLAAVTGLPNQPEQPGATPEVAPEKTDSAGAGTPNDFSKMSLIGYIGFCFGAGLLSLLLPCVFPMIPITVSYFSKQKAEDEKINIKGPLWYCLGIIGTFTGLGLLVTAVFGATGIQNLATNPWVNGLMFLVFVGLGLSLFGVFNIALPSGLVNKVSAKSRTGGVLGPVLMGLTFTLTSFTCTVPVVGALLVAASKGDFLRPTIGMLCFSTAFAFPFFLLALFPGYLSKLPRSGSWMNTVKSFMGFLELAFAVKFLSNIDVVYQWGLITRPIALGVWFALAVIAAGYLFGWLQIATDHGASKIGWLRRGFGVATLVGGVMCLAAMEGYNLGKIGALLPPDPYPGRESKSENALPWMKDYKEAIAQAQASGKPVFVNFTGYTCTNCRYMEQNILPKGDVRKEFNDMVIVELYTDGKTDDNKQNQQLQQKLTGSVTLPVYVVLSPKGDVLSQFGGSTEDPDEFLKFIRDGKSKAGAVARR